MLFFAVSPLLILSFVFPLSLFIIINKFYLSPPISNSFNVFINDSFTFSPFWLLLVVMYLSNFVSPALVLAFDVIVYYQQIFSQPYSNTFFNEPNSCFTSLKIFLYLSKIFLWFMKLGEGGAYLIIILLLNSTMLISPSNILMRLSLN